MTGISFRAAFQTLGVMAVCFVLCTFALGISSKPQFTSFDAPGAGTGAGQGTIAIEITAQGLISGYYIDGGGVFHGFVRGLNGNITSYDAPGAGTGAGQGTAIYSQVPGGLFTGEYASSDNVVHGFVASINGYFASFDPAGAHHQRNDYQLRCSGRGHRARPRHSNG